MPNGAGEIIGQMQRWARAMSLRTRVAGLAPNILNWEDAELWYRVISPNVCLQTCLLQSILPDAARVIFLDLRAEHIILPIEPSMSLNSCRIELKPLSMAFKALMIIPGLCMSLLPQLCHKETVLPFLLLCFSSCRVRALERERDRWTPGYVSIPQLPGSWEKENLHFHLSGKHEM